jgi:hypothetical protein
MPTYNIVFKTATLELDVMVYAYNPSYLGGRGRNCGSRPAWAKHEALYEKQTKSKKGPGHDSSDKVLA